MTRRRWLQTVPPAAALALGGCGREETRADLVFISPSEPETLDPAKATDQASGRVISSLFEGLMRWNEAGVAIPGAAAALPDISPDGRVHTFRLRSDARWSNGDAVTAQDFLESWQRLLAPETAADYATILHLVKNAKAFNTGALTDFAQVGLRVPAPDVFEVTLENPAPYFLDLCALFTLCPVHAGALEAAGTRYWQPGSLVGNGAYALREWRLNYRIVLERRDHYWDRANVACRTVELRTINNAVTALNHFVTGGADLAVDKDGVPTTLVDHLRKQTWFHSGPMLATAFLRFNCQNASSPFADPRVRRAFGLSIDRQRLVDRVTKMGEPPAFSISPPGCGGGYAPPPQPALTDIDEARRLMAAAGYPQGKGFPLVNYLYPSRDADIALAIEMQAMWEAALGVRIQPQKQEWKVYLDSMKKVNYDICRSSWVGDYNDPNTFLDIFLADSGNNRTGWKSADYDALIVAAAEEPDRGKRFALFQQAERLLIQEAAVISPVYHFVGVQFYRPEQWTGVQANLVDEHPFRCVRPVG